MPPKKKTKKTKQSQSSPETADEYLAEAVFQEESAEKWRAGDAQKAARFYSRALNIYEEALKLFPSSFDLAYNKARIQYEITQWPAIRNEFSTSTVQLLETALASHQVALNLEPDNDADAMFNTAQVLTSLAEAIDNDTWENVHLQEAVFLFHRCLERQQLLLEQSQAQIKQGDETLQEQDDTDQGDGGVSLNQTEQSALLSEDVEEGEEETDQWATIVNPITYTTLLETCVSLFSAISALTTLYNNASELTTLQPVITTLLDNKIPTYTAHVSTADSQETLQELALEILKYYAAITDAQYRLKVTTFEDYDATLKQIFSQQPQQELAPIIQILDHHSPGYLTSQADALVTFTTSTSDVEGKATLRYNRLSKALDYLTEAAKHPAAKDVASVHIGRGDAELLRFQLTKCDDLPKNISNTAVIQTLLGNAATFYRGAASVAHAGLGGGGLAREPGVAVEALTKEAVVNSVIAGDPAALVQLNAEGVSEDEIRKIVNEMADHALVTDMERLRAQIA